VIDFGRGEVIRTLDPVQAEYRASSSGYVRLGKKRPSGKDRC
jgi:hypothetical protein